MSKQRIPRKLKKRIKKNRRAWAILCAEAFIRARRSPARSKSYLEHLQEYPLTPEECFTWNIQGQKKGATN